VLHPASLPGIWHFGSVRGRVLELHSTEGLLARMRAGVASQVLPTDASLAFVPPGKESDTTLVSLPAGPNLPGWRLALSLNDRQLFEAAAKQRIASYIWIVALVVATVVILAALVLRVVRRQMALTQLRNDLVANVTHELKTPLASMRLLVETLLNTQPLHEPTAREYLQLIAQENLRLSRLIDNFLTFSRIERNK
jgi:signal transduction histidine kinase